MSRPAAVMLLSAWLGWKVTAGDISPRMLENAAKLLAESGFSLQTHLFPAEEMPFAAHSFDVVTVLESLYYMPDPRRELSRLAQLLKEDGLLAIAVPGYTYQRLLHGSGSSWANSQSCSLTTSHIFYFS